MSPVLGLIASNLDKQEKRAETTVGTGQPSAQPSSFKRGGKVKKGGRAKVHKGEVVLTKKQAVRLRRKRASRSKR